LIDKSMAIKKLQASKNWDFSEIGSTISNQFQNLNKDDPGSWPALPRYITYFAITALVLGALGYFWLSNYHDEWVAEEAKEVALRSEYKTKLAKAINLDALKKQREQVLSYVNQLEKQLPSKAEMDALLSDINQAGIGRSLQFELFRPGQVNVKEFYAELPIAVKVTGKYHDIGSFVSDVAYLSRIVTLNNLTISPVAGKDGALTMEVTAKTFRYLDADEITVQRKAKEKAGGDAK
jgi:type IV pilus assembly protein PilO